MLALFSEANVQVYDLIDPEGEVHDYPGIPDREWHHGHDGWVTFALKHRELFHGIQVVPSELVEAADGTLVARVEITAAGKRSGIPITEVIYGTFVVRDGKVLRADTFATRAEALEAVGLLE